MERYAVRTDTNLLIMAKHIFGEDSVDSAYIAEPLYGGNTGSEDYIQRELLRCEFKSVEIDINCDSKTIIIKFKNGNLVLFGTSEWGGISRVVETSLIPV